MATVCTVLVVSPSVMLGGLSVLIRRDLGFDEAQLGLAVGVFFAVTALTSIHGGRVADRLGARRALVIGAVTSAMGLAAMGALTQSWRDLVLCLVVAGTANGLAQPAANIALARGVSPRRQGLAFGMKQGAVPMAVGIVGVSIPVLGLTVGWRWTCVGTAAMLLTLVLLTIAGAPDAGGVSRLPRGRLTVSERRVLVVLAVATACGSTAASALTTFLAESTVRNGYSLRQAAAVLVMGSVVGVATRLGVGWLADRRGSTRMGGIAAMLLAGSLGYLALAFSEHVVLLVVGTALGFGAGWGWPGLLVFAVVRRHHRFPGAATGVTQAGAAAGGVLGPVVFGVLAAQVSFRAVWLAAMASALAAAALVVWSVRLAPVEE